MGIKRIIWNVGRGIFKALPLSLAARIHIRNFLFTLLGSKASALPGYHDWKLRSSEGRIKTFFEDPSEVWAREYAHDARPVFLFISHDMGGGTEQHIRFLREKLGKEGVRVLALRHTDSRSSNIFLHGFAPDATSRLAFDASDGGASLINFLQGISLKHIHVHHTLHMPDNLLHIVPRLAKELGTSYDFTAHDYLSICPRYTLYQDGTGSYCGEPNIKGCAGCLATYGSDYGRNVDMKNWRSNYAEFLHSARCVFTPDDDVSDRLKRYFPSANIITRAHEEIIPVFENLGAVREQNTPLKIVIIGAIAPHKGAKIIYECAQDALDRKLDIHFTVIGYTAEDYRRSPLANMTITGGYDDAKLYALLKEGGFHVAFFPAVWPETYSYTLSLALRYGIYPVAYDIGAVARRIRAARFGGVLPYALFSSASATNDALLGITPTMPNTEHLKNCFSRYDNYLQGYYGLSASVI